MASCKGAIGTQLTNLLQVVFHAIDGADNRSIVHVGKALVPCIPSEELQSGIAAAMS